MNKLTLIAAGAAATLLAVTWSVTVQLSDYASTDLQDSSPMPAWHHGPPPLPIATAVETNHDGMANSLAQRKAGRILPFGTYVKYRRYIDQNFQRFNTVQQIALEFHLNAADLDRMFRHYGHVSLDKYLTHLKKNQAADLGQG